MKTDQSNLGSGKTQFNRGKPKGQSWTELRDKARKPKKDGQDVGK